MKPDRAVFLWSGGKDSALALFEVLRDGRHEVAALLTTVTQEYDRISMHGVRSALLRDQAAALGLQLEEVPIPRQCTNEEYERRMREVCRGYAEAGVRTVIAGDLFLEDVRRYREENLAKAGMRAVFPLWGRDTGELARAVIRQGFKAVTCCVDSHILDRSFVGQDFDAAFLARLPAGADLCGENGEFHTFVYDGPPFSRPIPHARGEVVLRDGRYWYCDLLPSGRHSRA